jgi:diacylglycerol kinase (ATP)
MKGRVISFRYAFAGVGYVLRTQPNARIHTAITLLVLALGLWLGLGRLEWAVLWIAIGLVWASELMNTALEAVIDLVSPQFHPLAKIGKDAAAAGVLLAAAAAVVVGLLVLGPPLWARLFAGPLG